MANGRCSSKKCLSNDGSSFTCRAVHKCDFWGPSWDLLWVQGRFHRHDHIDVCVRTTLSKGRGLDWRLSFCCQEIPHTPLSKCSCIFTLHWALWITKPVLRRSLSLELSKFFRRLQRYRKIRLLTCSAFTYLYGDPTLLKCSCWCSLAWKLTLEGTHFSWTSSTFIYICVATR